MHYTRWRKFGDPLKTLKDWGTQLGDCIVTGCKKPKRTKGYCDKHYGRFLKHGDPSVVLRQSESIDGRRTTQQGYIHLRGYRDHPNSFPNGCIAEHVLVMSEHLGRPLLPHENVHHKNGMRDDNTLENLELWTRQQPTGQRVDDKVAWAVELLRTYRPELLAQPTKE
jgi:hypothetical protein